MNKIKLKEDLRHKVAMIASALEIMISFVVLLGILVVGVRVVMEVFSLVKTDNPAGDFTLFLGHAFNLIIGVEFIKMLAKHTPGSAIEVLLFAIARQMVVEHTTPFENMIGIFTIAMIFAIRKFLFVPSFGTHKPSGAEDPDETVFLNSESAAASEQ